MKTNIEYTEVLKDHISTTMSMKTKTFTFGDEQANEVRVKAVGQDRIKRAQKIYDAANDEGTIQASAARELFSRPEHHTTMSLVRAFGLAGFSVEESI